MGIVGGCGGARAIAAAATGDEDAVIVLHSTSSASAPGHELNRAGRDTHHRWTCTSTMRVTDHNGRRPPSSSPSPSHPERRTTAGPATARAVPGGCCPPGGGRRIGPVHVAYGQVSEVSVPVPWGAGRRAGCRAPPNRTHHPRPDPAGDVQPVALGLAGSGIPGVGVGGYRKWPAWHRPAW